MLIRRRRHETSNENANLIFISNDLIPPHDRLTDRIASVVDHGPRGHRNPFTCRIHGIRNEVAGRADLPIGAMPIGDITAVNAAGAEDGLKPGPHVVGNVVPLAVVEGRRRRRNQYPNCKRESRHRSRHDHGVSSAGGTIDPAALPTCFSGRPCSASNARILESVPSWSPIGARPADAKPWRSPASIEASRAGSLPPEILERVRCQDRIDRCRGYRSVPQPSLNGPGIVTLVGERTAQAWRSMYG